MKNKIIYIILIVVFLAGLSLLLYPIVSNAYNVWLQSRAIAAYSGQMEQIDREQYEKELQKAQTHNELLLERTDPYSLPDEMIDGYNSTLAMTPGIMAYVQIPTIDVLLPIAHGTSEDVLKNKIGHLEWSSLPIGGENTHAVISGHTGLPSSKLFNDIGHLEKGDKFYIHVLGDTLEYQVFNIAVVEPEDQRLLRIAEGQDLVTLVTCTPYGINSHRLLVQGIRTGTQSEDLPVDLQVKNEITAVDVILVVSVALVGIAVIAFVVVLLSSKKKKGGQQNEKTDP